MIGILGPVVDVVSVFVCCCCVEWCPLLLRRLAFHSPFFYSCLNLFSRTQILAALDVLVSLLSLKMVRDWLCRLMVRMVCCQLHTTRENLLLSLSERGMTPNQDTFPHPPHSVQGREHFLSILVRGKCPANGEKEDRFSIFSRMGDYAEKSRVLVPCAILQVFQYCGFIAQIYVEML